MHYKDYNRRAFRLLAQMILQMSSDLFYVRRRKSADNLNAVFARRRARRDLETFRNWRVFEYADALGMQFPNEEQVQRYLEDPKRPPRQGVMLRKG